MRGVVMAGLPPRCSHHTHPPAPRPCTTSESFPAVLHADCDRYKSCYLGVMKVDDDVFADVPGLDRLLTANVDPLKLSSLKIFPSAGPLESDAGHLGHKGTALRPLLYLSGETLSVAFGRAP